jgi:NAD+ synthase (glutamine-hydrolysing)
MNEQAGREIIPAAVLDKPPSAELAPGQKDSDSLPPYDELDAILKWHIDGEPRPAANQATVERILRMVARNEYKRRQAPPLIRVRPRAFGSGRQMPLAAKHLSTT